MEKKNFLIIEDNRDIAYQLQVRLEAKGYRVHVAYNGNDGLRQARSLKPDLILLDLMLPDIDGYKICRMLKFDVEYEHIPIIILSGRTLQEDRELAAETGANAYLTKPIDWKELFAILQTFAEEPQNHASRTKIYAQEDDKESANKAAG